MMEPELIAELYLYPTAQGGKSHPIKQGFRCPAYAEKDTKMFPHIGDLPIAPGERRRVGFSFIHPGAAPELRAATTFYLWDGRFFAEAVVAPEVKL